MQAAAAMQTVAGGGKKTWVDILCDNLCELGSLELKILLQCRVVSREWLGALDRALPLLRLVSFPIGVTGEGPTSAYCICTPRFSTLDGPKIR